MKTYLASMLVRIDNFMSWDLILDWLNKIISAKEVKCVDVESW